MFLRNSVLEVVGEVEFVENEASEGGAIAATARSQVSPQIRAFCLVNFSGVKYEELSRKIKVMIQLDCGLSNGLLSCVSIR